MRPIETVTSLQAPGDKINVVGMHTVQSFFEHFEIYLKLGGVFSIQWHVQTVPQGYISGLR
jgi:hypothetical protein